MASTTLSESLCGFDSGFADSKIPLIQSSMFSILSLPSALLDGALQVSECRDAVGEGPGRYRGRGEGGVEVSADLQCPA